MILQTDSRLNESINKFGCYFMSILYLANKHAGTEFDTWIILDMYEAAVINGYMDRNCFIKDPEAIFLMAGLRVVYTDRHEPPTRVCADDEIEILRFKHPDFPGYSHFVAGNGIGFVAHDPWGVSKSISGSLKDKRIFKLVA